MIKTITDNVLVSNKESVRQAMHKMDLTKGKIVYVVNENEELMGSLSGGDIRRYIVSGGALDDSINEVYNPEPRYVYSDYDIADVRNMMLKYVIASVPVTNPQRQIIDILFWDSVFNEFPKPVRKRLSLPVVIMAGGKGTRLDPFTRILPKPLIPIENTPVIELVIERFLEYSMSQFYISVNHKSRILKAYFEEWNLNYLIRWLEEEEPLGTAGALKLLEGKVAGPLFVSNCDVIVDCDYAKIYDYHQDKDNDITLIASPKRYDIPYGVCEVEKDGSLVQINEKPNYNFLVNIGVYLVNDSVLKYIPQDTVFDFTDLIAAVQNNNGKVGVYPVAEDAWVDVGEWDVYKKAVKTIRDD